MIVRAAQPVAADATDFRYRRILAPMDGTPRAEYVLPAASAPARAHEAQIVLVHIVQGPPMPRRTPPSCEEGGVAGGRAGADRIFYLERCAMAEIAGNAQHDAHRGRCANAGCRSYSVSSTIEILLDGRG